MTSSLFRGVFARNVAWTFWRMLFVLFMSFATSAVVARLLGPSNKGILALATLLPNVLILVFTGGFNVSNAYFAGTGRFAVEKLLETSAMVVLLGTLVSWIIAGIVVSTDVANTILPGVPPWAVGLASILVPFGLMNAMWSGILQGRRAIMQVNRVQAAQAGAAFCLTILLVAGLHQGLLGALIAIVLAAVSGMIGLLFSVKGNNHNLVAIWHVDVMRASVSFGLRSHIGNILQYLNYRLDVLLVNLFMGPAAVGIYTVAYGLAELLWNLPNAISYVLFPQVVAEQRGLSKTRTTIILMATLTMTAFGGLVLVLVGRNLIELIFSNSYSTAYLPLLALLPGVILLSGGKVLTAEILGRGYPEYNTFLSAVGLAVTVAAALLMIPRLGVLGAAMASSLSYTCMFLITVVFYGTVKRRTRGHDGAQA